MIAQEVADNKRDLDNVLQSFPEKQKRLDDALRMSEELLLTQKSAVNEIKLEFNLADLNAASWQSAERTGALSHMDYAEVKNYAGVYGLQAVYSEHQRRAIEHAAGAIAILAAGDPHNASVNDMQLFRQHVLAMRGDLVVGRQLGEQLSQGYASLIAP